MHMRTKGLLYIRTIEQEGCISFFLADHNQDVRGEHNGNDRIITLPARCLCI